MKLARLIAILLLATTVALAADNPPQAANPQSTQDLQQQITKRDFALPTTGFLNNKARSFITLGSKSDSDVCLTMRTYTYRRVDGGDAMEPVGYRTCTPASRALIRRTGQQRFKVQK